MPTHIGRELSVIVIVDLGVSSNQWWRRSGGWGGARAHKRRDKAMERIERRDTESRCSTKMTSEYPEIANADSEGGVCRVWIHFFEKSFFF
jgi:hypothetical protein